MSSNLVVSLSVILNKTPLMLKITILLCDSSNPESGKRVSDDGAILFYIKSPDAYKVVALAKNILRFISDLDNNDLEISSQLGTVFNDILGLHLHLYLAYDTDFKDKKISTPFFTISNKYKNYIAAFKKYAYLVESPANVITPRTLVEALKKELAEQQIEDKVKFTEHIIDNTSPFHGIYAVGKGSDNVHGCLPRLVTVEFGFDSTNQYAMGLVGKGVTYDTGGLSIKPTEYMEDMFQDMAGSALMFYTSLLLYIEHGLKIICVLPIAENTISGNSYKPGDIIRTYNHKYIKVNNTDAEGRIILADAMEYLIKNYQCQYVLVACTLTGAAVVVGGKDTVIFSTDSQHIRDNISIHKSKITAEKMIELPEDSMYTEAIQFKTNQYKGVQNTGAGFGGGTSTAAAFVKHFYTNTKHEGHITKGYGHFDIAPLFDKKITDTKISGSNLLIALVEITYNIIVSDAK